MKSNRHRHVDTHHAHLNAIGELAGSFSVASKNAGAVAISMLVDQGYGLVQVLDAYDAQYRSRNLSCSSLISWQSSSACCSSKYLKRNMTWARLLGGVLLQAGAAAWTRHQ